jgi:hypothetical protein
MMIDETLLRLLPPVVRAKDFRLYTQDGRRLTDLWQNNGAAILGHTPTGVLRSLKNAAERGLHAPLPHAQEKRFHKALGALLPGMTFHLYRSDTALLRVLSAEGFPEPADAFPDPALGAAMPPPPAPMLWRPFLDSVPPRDRLLVPVLPLPWPEALRVLALPTGFAETAPVLLASQLIPPTILAAATRGVYDLIAVASVRGKPRYPRVEAALAGKPWLRWLRQGIYLCRADAPDNEAYAALFRRFLDQGFLLPPVQTQPLILPGALSPGEEAKLAALLGE